MADENKDSIIKNQKTEVCRTCGGAGYYADRNPKNPYGEPIQVQCPDC